MSRHLATPLVYRELDAQQTKSHPGSKPSEIADITPFHRLSPDERSRCMDLPPATSLETLFRHSGWVNARTRVRSAIVAANLPRARVDRFDSCGSDAVVEVSECGRHHRIRANYCGDRFCDPCNAARAEKVKQWLLEQMTGPCLFVTLTLKRDDKSLCERLNALLASFAKLRRLKWWRTKVSGGAAVVQITRGKLGDHWHVHLHLLISARFLDSFELSEHWSACAPGSHIVDVRPVKDPEHRAGYVARYATKGIDRSVVNDAEAIVECVCALRGRRLLVPFGSWFGSATEQAEKPEYRYRRVGRLDQIINAARSGSLWAIGVLRSLNRLDILPAAVAVAADANYYLPALNPDPPPDWGWNGPPE